MHNKTSPWFDLVALICGGLFPLAFAPVSFFPLSVIIPVVLFYVWYDTSARRVFRRGYLFGLGMFGVGVSWVYIAISDFGFTSAPVAFVLTAIFVAFLALFPATQAWLSQRLIRQLPVYTHALVFATFWLMFEWIRGWFMTGFPWLNTGYSHIDSPLAGFAPMIGVYGLSMLSILSSAVLWQLLQSRNKITVSFVIVSVAIWATGLVMLKIEWTQPVDKPINVAMVQANLPQITKWDPEQISYRMQRYEKLSDPLWLEHDVIVWPENALTILWQDAPPTYRERLELKAINSNTELVIGVPYGDVETIYHSSLVVLGKNNGLYHKRHLVPFGEYVPLPEFMKQLAGFFDMPMSGFSSGQTDQPPLVIAGQKMAPTICYEDAFGEQLIDFLPESTVLINGSNNAWYGKSWAAAQHLQIARMRALETGRQSIRATTTGISAFIDQKGQFLKLSEQHKQVVMSGKIQPYSGMTPYVSWGNYPVIIVMWLSLLGLVVLAFKYTKPA